MMSQDPNVKRNGVADEFDELSAHMLLVEQMRCSIHEGYTTLIFCNPDGLQTVVYVEFI